MNSKETFLQKYLPFAFKASQDSGLPVESVLAQAVQESGWSGSTLSNLYNNFFGIKADASWDGKSVSLPTTEYIGGKSQKVYASFRVYDNPYDSFMDWANFLKSNPRYTTHGVFSAKSAGEVADALQSAGYATDPNYASKLKNVIGQIRGTETFKEFIRGGDMIQNNPQLSTSFQNFLNENFPHGVSSSMYNAVQNEGIPKGSKPSVWDIVNWSGKKLVNAPVDHAEAITEHGLGMSLGEFGKNALVFGIIAIIALIVIMVVITSLQRGGISNE